MPPPQDNLGVFYPNMIRVNDDRERELNKERDEQERGLYMKK